VESDEGGRITRSFREKHRGIGRFREQAIEGLFDQLPAKPLERIRCISQIYSKLRVHAAEELSSALSDLLRQTGNRLPLDEADRVVAEINQVLADSRLAVLNEHSGRQSKLSIQRPSPSNGYGYLRLFDSQPSVSGKRAMLNLNKLGLDQTPVRLVEESSINSGPAR
jgi:hypothetical protein